MGCTELEFSGSSEINYNKIEIFCISCFTIDWGLIYIVKFQSFLTAYEVCVKKMLLCNGIYHLKLITYCLLKKTTAHNLVQIFTNLMNTFQYMLVQFSAVK